MDLEKDLLVYLVKDTQAIRIAMQKRVTKEYFLNFDKQKLLEIILWTFKKYSCLLTDPILKQLLEKSTTKETVEASKRILLLFHELSQTSTPPSPIEFVIDQIRDKYIDTSFDSALRSAASFRQNKDTKQALDVIQKSISKITTVSTDETFDEGYLGEDMKAIYEDYIAKEANPTILGGVRTGYSKFDEVTNGLQKGQVVVLIGSPKSGKSVLLINVARNILQNSVQEGKRVAIFVNEGGRKLVYRRLAALTTGINYTNLRDGKLTVDAKDRFKKTVDMYANSKSLYVCSIPPSICTPSFIKGKLEEKEVDGKFDLVLIDHLGLMSSDNDYANRGESWKKFDSITLELKSLAMEKQLPILTPFHVNRDGHKKKTTDYGIGDIGLSFEITKHIDMLISWRVVDQDQFELCHSGDIRMKIAASRDSEAALIELTADLDTMSIQEKPDSFSVKGAMRIPEGQVA